MQRMVVDLTEHGVSLEDGIVGLVEEGTERLDQRGSCTCACYCSRQRLNGTSSFKYQYNSIRLSALHENG
jgi:hypothetical protein